MSGRGGGSGSLAGPVPAKFTVTSVTLSVARLQANTFWLPLGLFVGLSLAVKSVALLRKTTVLPLALMIG